MFTDAYADAYIGVFGLGEFKVSGPSDLGSVKIACTQGTTQEISASHLAPHAHIVRFQDDATSGTAFMSGQNNNDRDLEHGRDGTCEEGSRP